MDADELSRNFSNHLVYLQLMTSLEPGEGNITTPTVKSALNEAFDFYKTTDEEGLLSKAPKLLETFQPIIERFKSLSPLKVSLEQVATDFNVLFKNGHDAYSFGLEYKWLYERMDCSRMGFPSDLPAHARIGIGHHAGRNSIEEQFLLHDAFFMLASAEEAFLNMHELAKNANQKDSPINLNNIYLANSDVAAYSRLCIISFFSFVEAFINSIGHDFFLRNSNLLSQNDVEILQGKKKDRFLSAEYKIEKFPSIIRPDKKSPIILSDTKQIKEPFTSFIEQTKLIRDSSVHYTPLKEPIWRKPSDWVENAHLSSKLCCQVAQEFLKACYPDKNQPQYLGNLDYDNLLSSAKEILKAKNDSLFYLHSSKGAT
ncbi:MAG: hypothetical protein KJZ72_11520, partial [Anaerolineales bacterium]|nr:hypothetical protein [Anaerolineales bacterium]